MAGEGSFTNELRRLEEIDAWFRGQGYTLRFDVDVDEDGFGGFIALVMRADQRVGVAVAEGSGTTQVQAAEAAQADFREAQSPAAQRVQTGLAEEVEQALPSTAHNVEAGGIPSEEAFGTPTVRQIPPAVLEPLDLIAGEYGWSISLADEPDGTVRWFVFDNDRRTLIKKGVAEALDDALLEAIEDLHRPSGER